MVPRSNFCAISRYRKRDAQLKAIFNISLTARVSPKDALDKVGKILT